MMKQFFEQTKPYSLILIRIWLGIAMMYHSAPVLFDGKVAQFAGYVESLGIPFPMLMAVLAKSSEFFGGLLVLTGVYARFGAFFIAITMFVAFGIAHDFLIFSEGARAIHFFLMAVTIFLGGSGKLSLKNWP